MKIAGATRRPQSFLHAIHAREQRPRPRTSQRRIENPFARIAKNPLWLRVFSRVW